jgi:hypothetical protein
MMAPLPSTRAAQWIEGLIRPAIHSRARVALFWMTLLMLGSLLFVWLISFASLVWLSGALRPPQLIEVVIPPGTAELVAAGQASTAIPTNIRFVSGDVLMVRNDDVAIHQVGPSTIRPGESVYISLDQPNLPTYICSIHPSGKLGLEVQPRGDLRLTLLPTLALGLPSGIVLSLIYLVMSRMKDG